MKTEDKLDLAKSLLIQAESNVRRAQIGIDHWTNLIKEGSALFEREEMEYYLKLHQEQLNYYQIQIELFRDVIIMYETEKETP